MNIKRNIIFCLESRKKEGKPIIENVPIRMRVIYNGKRIEFTTGYRIDVSKWDDAKQQVKNGCTNKLKQTSSEINANLKKYEGYLHDVFKEFEVKEILPTTEQIKQAFNDKHSNLSNDEEVNLFTVFDEFVQERGVQNSWAITTRKKFATVRKHLEEFDYKLSFSSLDESKLTDYINFLLHSKECANTTIIKHLKNFKEFLTWAEDKGYNNNLAFKKFKPKLKTIPKKVIFLTWEEIVLIMDFEIPKGKEHLEKYRDFLIFCCFTGLRYSDVENLKRSNIKENHIEIATIKDTDPVKIELNKYSRAILDKYKDVVFEKDQVIPIQTNQKTNDYIKELGKLVGLDEIIQTITYKGSERIEEEKPKYELLGTHIGRKTFICLALTILNISPEIVMRWTGHNDYKSMLPYIAVAEKIKASAMDRFNQL